MTVQSMALANSSHPAEHSAQDGGGDQYQHDRQKRQTTPAPAPLGPAAAADDPLVRAEEPEQQTPPRKEQQTEAAAPGVEVLAYHRQIRRTAAGAAPRRREIFPGVGIAISDRRSSGSAIGALRAVGIDFMAASGTFHSAKFLKYVRIDVTVLTISPRRAIFNC